MELGLSLGDNSRPFSFMEEPREASNQSGLQFNTTLSIGPVIITKQTDHQYQEQELQTVLINKHKISSTEEDHEATNESLLSPSLKANNEFDLLPHFSSSGTSRGFDVNMPAEEEAVLSSSPNSVALMDLCMFSKTGRRRDEDENRGRTRKRLRLSKEQSSLLEESFKHHNILVNPKQKIALAKQLHLRPRQVEVWFQNRRARTKLKKIELDCKYLKKCCDTLTEENTRLHKELQELRALKTWHHQHCKTIDD